MAEQHKARVCLFVIFFERKRSCSEDEEGNWGDNEQASYQIKYGSVANSL